MGQAFRRAAGKMRASNPETTSSASSKSAIDRRPAAVAADKVEIPKTDGSRSGGRDPDNGLKINSENILEERDPSYDALLSQMVGRIKSKSGGKLEMGEADVVERYNRPLPKLRNTKPESGRFEEQTVPPGTLNVAQLRHIILLHQGKADDYDGPMEIHQIAERFRIDTKQVQKILQFVALPPEDDNKQENLR